jgi:uncharacterized protein
MKIDYSKYLHKNLINVFKDVLMDVEKNGLKESHHLYISFLTNHSGVIISNFLKEQFPTEMTIVIQYEYWDLKIKDNSFEISLSFNNLRENLIIPFNSVISFADPYADFGLKLIQKSKLNNEKDAKNITKDKLDKNKIKNNVIDFKSFKKN